MYCSPLRSWKHDFSALDRQEIYSNLEVKLLFLYAEIIKCDVCLRRSMF